MIKKIINSFAVVISDITWLFFKLDLALKKFMIWRFVIGCLKRVNKMGILIGVPKEIKNEEYRVGLTPASVRELVAHGHRVMVERHAGMGINIDDKEYAQAGAEIVNTAAKVFENADMIVKVKEPQAIECAMLRKGQLLFTYLHLAADLPQTHALLKSGCTAVAYETVTDSLGRLPLLTPMSEVAGRMAIQAGAHCLEKSRGGRGLLLGGVPGIEPAKVVIIGGGVVGTNAIRVAIGMEAKVTVLDKSLTRLNELDQQYGARLTTIYATRDAIEEYVCKADLIVGAVLVPGAAAPKLVTREMIKKMKPGSVIVDVAIDQGGCVETSKATTHTQPTYLVDHVVHYCVANMPGAVPYTSTFALNNATLPYVLELAHSDYKQRMLKNPGLLNGLNIHEGHLVCRAVADAFNLPYVSAKDVFLI